MPTQILGKIGPGVQPAGTPQKLYGEGAFNGIVAGQSSAVGALFGGLWWHTMRRNGIVLGRLLRQYGAAPAFHALVDPTIPIIPVVLTFDDYVSATIALGACEVAVGFHEHVVANNASTLVGIGFRAGVDHVWHTFVNDCPSGVAPVTVRRNTAIAGKLSSESHRLSIVFDGRTKTIKWLIDGVQVDIWVPPTPLDQMSPQPGPKLMYSVVVPLNGDVVLRVHAGGLPQLRIHW